MKVFISYSHKDESTLERLHTHLAVLRRDGRIDEWFDREILAGGEIDAEIAERLDSSRLFLLLVSRIFFPRTTALKGRWSEPLSAIGRATRELFPLS